MESARRKRHEQTTSGNAGAIPGRPLGPPLTPLFPKQDDEEDDWEECEECTEAREGDVAEMEVPFDIGDVVLFGKYKNKRGKILSFGTNDRGQPVVEIEPVPKGRKQNKTLGLYKVWTSEEVLADCWERMVTVGPPDEWSGGVASSMAAEERQVLQRAWESLSEAQKGQLQQEWQDEVEEAAPRRVKKRKPRSGARKLVKVCPTGMHIKGGRCSRVPRSQLAKMRRKKKKWRRSGAGKRSAKRSAMYKRRFGEALEGFIAEGRDLLE
jgi:hypothetical protein